MQDSFFMNLRRRFFALVICVTALSGGCTITDAEPAETTAPPPAAPLVEFLLEPGGLGELRFGAPPEDAIAELTPVVGAPDGDTSWIDGASSVYGRCPSEVRAVSWGSLVLLFAREGGLFAYSYGFDFDEAIAGSDPRSLQLATASGVGLGSTVAELMEAERHVTITGDEAIDVWSFAIDDAAEPHLRGLVGGPEPTDQVVLIETSTMCQ